MPRLVCMGAFDGDPGSQVVFSEADNNTRTEDRTADNERLHNEPGVQIVDS